MSNPAAESGSHAEAAAAITWPHVTSRPCSPVKRGLRNQHENTDGCVLKALRNARRWTSTWRKRCAYVYKGKRLTSVPGKGKEKSRVRVIWGRVTRPHGNSGAVRSQVQHQPCRRRRWASASESCCTRLVSNRWLAACVATDNQTLS
uniref:Large ribosomal subunit protein eL33 n=1 Tax=Macrostomum lignano TaxID=282301 RepID=A0A1I8JS61_9PLAT